MKRSEAIEVLTQLHDFLGKNWTLSKEALEFGIAELNLLTDLENMLIKLALFQGTIKADYLIEWLNHRHIMHEFREAEEEADE